MNKNFQDGESWNSERSCPGPDHHTAWRWAQDVYFTINMKTETESFCFQESFGLTRLMSSLEFLMLSLQSVREGIQIMTGSLISMYLFLLWWWWLRLSGMHSGFTSPQTCENAFKCWLQDSIFIKKKIENIIIIRSMILKLKCLEIQGLAVLNVKFWLDV